MTEKGNLVYLRGVKCKTKKPKMRRSYYLRSNHHSTFPRADPRKSVMSNRTIVPIELIEKRIYLFRGKRGMLDSHLAELYGVETKALNRAVKRNIDRFPEDFMFQLTEEEFDALRYQIDTSKETRGGRRYLPYVFTEQGVAMLSSVLRSKRAVRVNIQIMRTFVKLREMLATHKELARKLEELERKYDKQFRIIFDVIRKLMAPPEKPRRKIGFIKE